MVGDTGTRQRSEPCAGVLLGCRVHGHAEEYEFAGKAG